MWVKTYMEYGSLRSAERGTRNNMVDLSNRKIKSPYKTHWNNIIIQIKERTKPHRGSTQSKD